MKLPLKKIRVIIHFNETEHVENVLEEPAWLGPFGTGIKILSGQEDDPDKLSVDECQGEGKYKKNQFICLKPEHLERL